MKNEFFLTLAKKKRLGYIFLNVIVKEKKSKYWEQVNS